MLKYLCLTTLISYSISEKLTGKLNCLHTINYGYNYIHVLATCVMYGTKFNKGKTNKMGLG